MTITTKKLRTLTRRENPTGADILHLYSEETGKDHYVIVSDLLTGQSYDTWDVADTYAIGDRVTFGFKLYESLQNANTGHIPSGGVGDTWWKEVSESAKPDHLERTINKTTHGFVVKNVLTLNGSGALVKVSAPATEKFIGIVLEVIDVDNFRMSNGGYITGLTGLTAGSIHYAQADGTLSTTVSDLPVLLADSTSSGYILAGSSASIVVGYWKDPVKAATTANITLSGAQTIDGISIVADDRVLVKSQSTQSENGIYLCKAGAWVRTTDADAATELEGAAVTVQRGTSNENTTWLQTTDGITLGSSNIVWQQLGTSVPDASETVKGIIEIATQAETNTGTDDVRALTPKKLKDQNYLATLASPTFTGTPAAPTAALGTNTTQVATTEFVQQQIQTNIYLNQV